jgi:serine/threonine-protein kinase RsbT
VLDPPTARPETQRLTHWIRAGDIEHGGSASAQIKAALKRMGVDEDTARRVGIVAFEGEINLLVYAEQGGSLTVDVGERWIDIQVQDTGPGIEDIGLALTPGYSTAPEWAANLGFGAGLGLNNMQRISDQFEMKSSLTEGTRILCRIARRTDAAS